MMVVDPQEEQRIAERAERLAKIEGRIDAMEKAVARWSYVALTAAIAVGATLWEKITGVIFK